MQVKAESQLERLLAQAMQDPLPKGHTSSYWQIHGEATDFGMLKSSGFEDLPVSSHVKDLWHGVERPTYRSTISELGSYRAIWGRAKRLAREMNLALGFNVWKSTMVLSTLIDHGCTFENTVIIGDGFGFLGALIRRMFPEGILHCIDLPKILLFQAHTHQRAKTQAEFLAPDQIERVPELISIAINVTSMQEMLPSSIAAYFSFLRKRRTDRFYCVNRQEKILPGGEIIRFADYPWQANDKVLLDGPCPYLTHWLSSRPPFYRRFDGLTLHRLVELAPST